VIPVPPSTSSPTTSSTIPNPHLRALRDSGPVVRLDALDMYAVTRYDDVGRITVGEDLTKISLRAPA
jgi:hypothetical protein